jgi:hypothetical protein
MIRYKVSKQYDKAADILTNWHFIYEETPRGNLRAEPMDFSINDRLIQELGAAGYFSLPCRGGLSIRKIDERSVIS